MFVEILDVDSVSVLPLLLSKSKFIYPSFSRSAIELPFVEHSKFFDALIFAFKSILIGCVNVLASWNRAGLCYSRLLCFRKLSLAPNWNCVAIKVLWLNCLIVSQHFNFFSRQMRFHSIWLKHTKKELQNSIWNYRWTPKIYLHSTSIKFNWNNFNINKNFRCYNLLTLSTMSKHT